MDLSQLAFWMTVAGTICWGVCFWWMHRISTTQHNLLDELRKQGQRIEKLSLAEHDLIKQVHPQIGEIKEGMDQPKKENGRVLGAPLSETFDFGSGWWQTSLFSPAEEERCLVW